MRLALCDGSLCGAVALFPCQPLVLIHREAKGLEEKMTEGRLKEQVRQLTIRLVHMSLVKWKGNKTYTAKDLGVSVRSIRLWVSKHPELAKWKVDLW